MNWIRTNLNIVGAGAVTLLVLGFSTRQLMKSDAEPAAEGPPKKVLVKRVISGNAFKIEPDDRVTLAGIRAPYRREPLGDTVYERCRQLLEGQEVRLRFDEQPQDRKGRWLAYAFVGDTMVNRVLVEEGLAFVRLRDGERRFEADLLEAQKQARDQSKGLWSLVSGDSELRYVGDRKHGTFHRVQCADVTSIKPGREIEFKSKWEAFDHGFAPCGHCMP